MSPEEDTLISMGCMKCGNESFFVYKDKITNNVYLNCEYCGIFVDITNSKIKEELEEI